MGRCQCDNCESEGVAEGVAEGVSWRVTEGFIEGGQARESQFLTCARGVVVIVVVGRTEENTSSADGSQKAGD